MRSTGWGRDDPALGGFPFHSEAPPSPFARPRRHERFRQMPLAPCQAIASTAMAPETGSARLMTARSSTQKPSHVNYTIAPRLRGGFYVFAIVGSPEGASAVQGADARLDQAALRSLNTQ